MKKVTATVIVAGLHLVVTGKFIPVRYACGYELKFCSEKIYHKGEDISELLSYISAITVVNRAVSKEYKNKPCPESTDAARE